MSSKLPEIALPKSLEVQWHDEVALLRIVRPEKRNALDDPTVLGIDTFFSSIPEHVKAVVVEAGGENFSAVPCLNDSEPGMRVIEAVVLRELQGWV